MVVPGVEAVGRWRNDVGQRLAQKWARVPGDAQSMTSWIAVICFGLFAVVSARQLTRDHGPTVTVGSALLVFDVLVGCAGVAFVVAGIDEAYWPLALALLARVATQRLFELRDADAETDPTAGRRP